MKRMQRQKENVAMMVRTWMTSISAGIVNVNEENAKTK